MQIKWMIAKTMKYLLNPPALNDCRIDHLARVGARCELTKVSVGKHSYIGHQSFMVNTSVGSFCSIGERCCVGGGGTSDALCVDKPCFCQRIERHKV